MPRVNLGFSERERETVTAIREMYNANYLSLSEVGAFLGVNAETAKKLMQGVPCIKRGRSYRFSAQDVARAISKMEEIA